MPVNTDKSTISKLKKELSIAHRDLKKASTLFSSIGEAVIVTDEYGRIERVNSLTEKILGYSSNEMIGQRFFNIVKAVNEDGTLIPEIDRPITKAFLRGSAVFERLYYLTKYNSMVPIDTNVSPIIFNNKPSGAIEVFRDLTDEYIKEKIQSEFISLASHQLRTPLSSINTYSQMLSQGYAGKLTSKQLSFVSVIEKATSRMNDLIHTLLNVTRIEAGNITVNVKSIDIDNLCDEIVGSLEYLALERGISIKYTNDSITSVESDPVLLREVLSNFLTNAIKYTPRGGRVTLRVEANDRVVFSVKDNGYGIPEQSKNYVFSKFYRANNAVKNDVTGTGIGLYLAKEIAERLEGDIWFKSEINKGSTFYFSLPLIGSAEKQGKFTLEIPN